MKTKLFILGISLATSMSFARTTIVCNSFDVTFRPSHEVNISVLDVTHPDYYMVNIVEVLDLAGKQQKTYRYEGKGEVTAKHFLVDFKNGGRIEGKGLKEGKYKAELELKGKDAQELFCTTKNK